MARPESLLNTPEDCDWLRDTHLRHLPANSERLEFAAAVIRGNEDCPQEIELYVSSEPRVTDGCVRLKYDSETGEYVRA